MEQAIGLIEKLTGQPRPLMGQQTRTSSIRLFDKGSGIGYSQFNELLLTLGYDRVSEAFFGEFFGGTGTETPPIASYEHFSAGVDRFRIQAMLLYGNIKFAFRALSALDRPSLERKLSPLRPRPVAAYHGRLDPLHDIEVIPAKDAYLLGYLVWDEITRQVASKPDDPQLLSRLERIKHVRDVGRRNHDTYLAYDHMDVYVATSMREPHEFYFVRGFAEKLFERGELNDLRLRYFDPTQAYCDDRIDKGLVEGLMLKRAKCTIYHAQEGDTLGKDSELAATLAQGKPVIAFVPASIDLDAFKHDARELADTLYPGRAILDVFMDILPRYYPEGAWRDPRIRRWLDRVETPTDDEAIELLHEKANLIYDRRASMLSESHPLGLQVHLDTGVANGVLVVRTLADCAKLLRSILLNSMEFRIEERSIGARTDLLLRECISGCIYRSVTGDGLLTNSFWNFYLDEREGEPLLRREE